MKQESNRKCIAYVQILRVLAESFFIKSVRGLLERALQLKSLGTDGIYIAQCRWIFGNIVDNLGIHWLNNWVKQEKNRKKNEQFLLKFSEKLAESFFPYDPSRVIQIEHWIAKKFRNHCHNNSTTGYGVKKVKNIQEN